MAAIVFASIITACALAETTTVMVYMCGSNLETLYGAATKDVQEMALSGLDPLQTKVFVMVGGSENWQNNDIRKNVGGLYTFAKKSHGHGIRLIALENSSGSMNMGEGETLAYFLNYCREKNETDRYALILWDHGGGPMNGVCWDETHDADHLTIDEIVSALSSCGFQEKQLDWIGFDACLMSSVEVASKLSPYAKYMVSSQAEEPASGWNYAFLNGLENDRDGAATGERIIDAFFAVNPNAVCDLTLSCVDLSAISEIEVSMDAMFSPIAATLDEKTFSVISKMRFKTTSYGKSMGETKGSNSYDLVDLVSLCESYAEKNEKNAEAVCKAVEKAVVYNKANIPGSHGLSVYHPYRNQEKYTSEWKKTYEKMDFCSGYTSYINSYGDIMAGTHLVRWDNLKDIEVYNNGASINLNITQAQADNLASARLLVMAANLYDPADDSYFSVFSTANVTMDGTRLTAAYDGTTLQVLNESGYGQLSGAISYQMSEDGLYLVNLYPIDENLKRAEKPIVAEYLRDEASGELILKGYAVYDELMQNYSRRADIDLSQYRGITFQNEYRNPTINASGEYEAFSAWNKDVHTDTQWKARRDLDHTSFRLSFVPNSSTEECLYAAFEITDTQGNVYMSELSPIGGSVSFHEALPYLDSKAPNVFGAHALAYWNNRQIVYVLDVMNSSDKEKGYLISDVKVNGRPVPEAFGMLYKDYNIPADRLAPGEWGNLIIFLDEAAFEGIDVGDTIQSLIGTVYAYNIDSSSLEKVGFSIESMLSMETIYHAEDAPVQQQDYNEVTLVYPALEDRDLGFSCYAVIQPSNISANARLILNIALKNTVDYSISCAIRNMKINGVPLKNKFTMNVRGTGEVSSSGRSSIAPDETGIINIDLRYDDIAPLAPDVSLVSISGDMLISKVADGDSSIQYSIPTLFELDVPLNNFYPEASVLPSQQLVEYGRENGMLDDATKKPLFTYGGCTVYLQGSYIVGREPVLLLRCVNDSDINWKISLGQAEIDGVKAVMGKTESTYIQNRNDRNRTYGIQHEPWPSEMSALAVLRAHSDSYHYVSVTPTDDNQDKMKTISFHAYMMEAGQPLNCVYSDAIEISTEEPGPLMAGIEGAAPAEDYLIRMGNPLPLETNAHILQDTVLLPDGYVYSEISLRYELPEQDEMADGFYILMRKLRSDKELAELNIQNMINTKTYKAALSFEDGLEWMAYEANGALKLSDDGRFAVAALPNMRLLVGADGETMPVNVCGITNEGNTVNFHQEGNLLQFNAGVFPNITLAHAIHSFSVNYDKEKNTAQIVSFKQTQQSYASLAGMMIQELFLLPSDSSSKAVSAFLNDDDNMQSKNAQYQVLPLSSPQIWLSLEPIEQPDDFCVFFWYITKDMHLKCSEPIPLSNFIQPGE